MPPAVRCVGDPAFGKGLANLRLPLWLAVGLRDLSVERDTVGVLVGDQALDRIALRQRHGVRVAQRDQPVVGEADRAGSSALR